MNNSPKLLASFSIVLILTTIFPAAGYARHSPRPNRAASKAPAPRQITDNRRGAAARNFKINRFIANSQNAATDWLGTYRSDDKNPAIGGDYTITVEQSGENLTATIKAEGIQLYDFFECSVKTDGNAISFYFVRNLDDPEVYANGRAIRRGELVGSLTLVRSGRRSRFLYKPGAYEIAFGRGRKAPPPAYFFKRK